MREEFRFLYSANYLLALATVSASIAFIVDKPFWLAVAVALGVVVLLAVLFKLDSPDINANASPRTLAMGHSTLLLGHALFWPAVIAMNVLEGNASYLVFLIGSAMLIPGAAICYLAGLAMIEFCRLRWRGE